MNRNKWLHLSIIAVAFVGVAAYVLIGRDFGEMRNELEQKAVNTGTEIPAQGALDTFVSSELFFTEKGCASTPYILALSNNEILYPDDAVISAPDGYDYAILPDTRAKRVVQSQFDGACKDIPMAESDTIQVFEIGITESEE